MYYQQKNGFMGPSASVMADDFNINICTSHIDNAENERPEEYGEKRSRRIP
jgi:hypothetical protein